MVVEPPNKLAVVGEYLYFINNWLVSLKVTAPCSTKNIQGLDEEGSLNIRLDDEKTLVPELELDSDGSSWEIYCGRISRTVLLNAPNFVTQSLKNGTISVKPTELRHLGFHITLVQ